MSIFTRADSGTRVSVQIKDSRTAVEVGTIRMSTMIAYITLEAAETRVSTSQQK